MRENGKTPQVAGPGMVSLQALFPQPFFGTRISFNQHDFIRMYPKQTMTKFQMPTSFQHSWLARDCTCGS